MKTYTQINNLLQTIADNHLMIQHYASGGMDEVDINKLAQTQYPFLYAELLGADIDNGVISYDIELLVAELIEPDLSDRTQVYSDTLQMLHDVLNQFIQSLANTNTTVDNDYKVELPISCTPFTVRFDNHLTGFSATITVEVSNKNDLCISPY